MENIVQSTRGASALKGAASRAQVLEYLGGAAASVRLQYPLFTEMLFSRVFWRADLGGLVVEGIEGTQSRSMTADLAATQI
jgi:hypothetical protein